jgi:putative component of membrane protein insertase Oxa1/YidC/SpoIIIJ protein YidD
MGANELLAIISVHQRFISSNRFLSCRFQLSESSGTAASSAAREALSLFAAARGREEEENRESNESHE